MGNEYEEMMKKAYRVAKPRIPGNSPPPPPEEPDYRIETNVYRKRQRDE